VNPAFTTVDRLVLLAYAAVVLALGLQRLLRPRRDDLTSYLVAGRAVTLPGFVMNLVATWYGGILGVGEYSYRYGISNWLVFGVPYYVAALLFAIFLAPRARRARVLTIPEQLHASYGRNAGLLGAVVVLLMTVPGAYVLMAGTIVREVLGWPLAVAATCVTLLSSLYLVFGGMRAIVAADKFYFVLMYSSFGFMVVWLATHFGGLEFLRSRLPPESFTWNGGRPVQAILVWYGIALATLIEPSFYEACFSAKDQRTARIGILVSIVFWALFDAMSTTTGMYARALLGGLDEPSRAFPLLALRVLPPFLLGLFFAGMLAVVMSTVDSYLFISAQTLGRDLAWRWWGRRSASPTADASNRWVRVALLVTSLGAIGIALSGLGVIELWHHLGSIGTPALLVPMLASFDARWRFTPRGAIAAILLAAAVATLWLVTSRGERYWLGLEPILPALATSAIVWCVDRAWRRRGGQAVQIPSA
jgi:SSS family solute:Na+ symporter